MAAERNRPGVVTPMKSRIMQIRKREPQPHVWDKRRLICPSVAMHGSKA